MNSGTKLGFIRPPPTGCDKTLYKDDNWYKMGAETAAAWAQSITTGAQNCCAQERGGGGEREGEGETESQRHRDIGGN